MGISSAAYDSLSPTDLDNFTNPLRLPGGDGVMGILDASAYPVENRGATYWYHPHAHGTNARQTYSGLAGLFIVEDEEEQRLSEALDLKLGGTDIPLLIQDKMFDEGGNFVYAPGQMDVEMGYHGDVVLTNLTPNPYLEVGTRIHRFRILNGSNARNLRLAFSRAGDDLLPYHVIATDASLLERPARAMEVFLSPAERVEVLVDLRGFEVGEEVVARSLPFDPMHNEHEMGGKMEHMDMGHHHHMGHHMGPARLPDRNGFYLLRLVVSERVDYARRVLEILSEPTRQDFAGATARPIPLSMATEGGANR
jgi:blue copper oxidase